MRKSVLTCLAVAIAVNITAAAIYGVSRPMESDAMYYLDIAKNLVAGKGFVLTHGFWPDQPTMSRSPAWPTLVAGALRIAHRAESMGQRAWRRGEKSVSSEQLSVISNQCPVASEDNGSSGRSAPSSMLYAVLTPDALMRVLCLLLNSLNALLVMLLALKLGANRLQSAVAGGLYLFYPTALYLAVGGASEILFLTLTLGGAWSMAHGAWSRQVAQRAQRTEDEGQESDCRSRVHDLCSMPSALCGCLLLGLAALVRANFVIWIAVFLLLIIATDAAGRRVRQDDHLAPTGRRRIVCAMLFAICFLTPSLLWALRNYQVSGVFPVLSTLRGQTFYGGNNPVVQRLGQYWGYWVFPDEIAGETTMRELAKSMSEVEIDCYYTHKGQEFIRANWRELPLLAVGKLVRAYVPVPWKLSPGLLVVNGYRFLLYLLIAVGLWRLWRQTPVEYRLLAISMVLVNVITVIGFWGCARFAFAVEPFLVPFAAFGLTRK